MTPFEYQQKIKANIIGSYNNVNSFVKSEESKPVGQEEKKEAPESVEADEAKKEQAEENKDVKEGDKVEGKKDKDKKEEAE